jgi:hemerythrin-like metal-binding protein
MGTKLIEWHQAFDLGLEELDNDHKKLVEYTNELNNLIKQNADNILISKILDNILLHLRAHFNREESILKKIQDEATANKHHESHEESFNYLSQLRDRYKNEPETISGDRLLNFLHQWIINHIFNHDHKMLPDLEKAGLITNQQEKTGILEKFLDRFNLSIRIAALGIFPLLAMLYFSGSSVLDKRATVQEMDKIVQLSNMAGVFSNLVHELQKERGASAGFLGSKGKSFGDKVTAQRKNTDEKNKPIADALNLGTSLGLKTQITHIREKLSQLNTIRDSVDAQTITVAQEVGYYSALNADLLNAITAMSKISSDLSISNRISAFVNFLQSKERAGIERAKGSVGFGSGKFGPALLEDFIGLIAIQNTYMKVSRAYASAETISFMDKTIAGEAVDMVEKMRTIAISSPVSNSLDGITGPQWFDTITKKINSLKTVENYMATALVKQANTVRDTANHAFITLLTVSLLITIFILIFAFVLIHSVVNPLKLIRKSIERLEQGHTETLIAGRHKQDEIGDMARAIQNFKETIIRQNMEQTKHGIEQSVRERTSTRRLKITNQFQDRVANAIESMASAAEQLEHNADAMSKATDNARSQSAMVASAATQATSNVETVAAAAEELSSSIQEITRQVEHSSTIANNATESAHQAQETIQGLAQGANKIGEVVSMITSIAEQTNLLALNATIEAARAGEAGKGFAVVASEVKNLANQTAKATEEITAQINTIQTDTQRAVHAIEEVSETISKMNEVTITVSEAVEQQGNATQEISSNVNEAATGTRDVSNNIEGVAHSTEETGRMSGEVFNSAKMVSDNASDLKQQIDDFLKEVAKA